MSPRSSGTCSRRTRRGAPSSRDRLFRDDALGDRGNAGGVADPRVLRAHLGRRREPETPSQLAIREQPVARARERVRLRGRVEQTGLAVADDLLDLPDARRDDGRRTAHVLEELEWREVEVVLE